MLSSEEINSYYRIFEDQFAIQEYQGQTGAQKAFDVKWGTIPILVSAPHSTKVFRNNRMKDEDDYTGTIGLLLQRYTNCHLIYTTRCSLEDPNYLIDGEYKEQIGKITKLANIRYVIDLRGASTRRDFDVDLGTQNGLTINQKAVSQLKEIFYKNKIMNVKENHTFPANHQGTITSYCYHQLGLQSMQMEIHKKFRNPNRNLDLFTKMMQAIYEFIYTLQET